MRLELKGPAAVTRARRRQAGELESLQELDALDLIVAVRGLSVQRLARLVAELVIVTEALQAEIDAIKGKEAR
jgi:hypothetical protein